MPSYSDPRLVHGANVGQSFWYTASDEDSTEEIKYYGFISPIGSWFIMKEETVDSVVTFRYAAGKQNYSTNWTGRVGLSYGYYNEVM
jgi:hypothetical protein